ncbi:MAG TPA: formate dehydrogenase accessory sulfurtransferase FdhD [Gammaproteobacteria bacterium]|nr:formate dehydrogenase accessory sulfurtransferase FdhD [Gammaproteobacteria bacterium]
MARPSPAGAARRLPELTDAGLKATANVIAKNEYNEPVEGAIAVERALTLYLDRREIVTLMTLGNHPELLILGWLRNQRMIEDIEAIRAIQVDWEIESAAIVTYEGVDNLDARLERKTVTTGCGQGTVFGDLMEDIDDIRLTAPRLKQSSIYALLKALNEYNEVYKNAGAVHGCALCSEDQGIELFIEDVGRHNAVDAIAGHMWLNDIGGEGKLFYTTGRLTSEMVIKVALMGIPVLLSRSGITAMGLEIAQRVGVTLIARAKGRHFLVYHGGESIDYDDMPPPRPPRADRDSRHSPD